MYNTARYDGMEQIGRYEILGGIGRGGFGVVYRAHDPVMRRDVAIKVLTTFSDPALLARFRSEAGTTGNLRHKNIITVYDYGEHAGQPFLVMELLEGRSLQEVIRNGPPLSLFEKVNVLLQVAEGLRFAHERGVVHRDVKPSNVMLLNDGGAKILDFGIARFLDASRTRHTTPGFLLGTIEYMSPDQLQGVDADPLTDIFSFGVICYELLSGHQPFRADTVSRIMYLLATTDPAPLCQVVPGCPEALQNMVRTALAKDRSQRYQNVQELLFDLAPVEAALRRERAMDLAVEVGRLIGIGNLDNAQLFLNRMIELDPACEKGQELRREIQRRRERRDLLRQAEALVATGGERMAGKSFDAALEAFESALRIIPADAGPMRADAERRLFVASQSRETARRFAALLTEAREAVQRGNLPAALQLAAKAAALDPSSREAAALTRQLAAETQRQEAEAERQRQECLRHDETISSVTQAVRGHVVAKHYTDALRLVEGALGQYPEDEVLEKVRDAVREARRRYAAELEAERQQAIERQRQAEEQLRLLEAERGEEQRPGQEPQAEQVPREESSRVPAAEEGGRRLSVQEAGNAPPAPPRTATPPPFPAASPPVPAASAGSNYPTRARLAPIPRPASPRSRVGRRTMVLAAVGLTALVLGFWLLPSSEDAHSVQLRSQVQKAIRDRNWTEAERRLNDYADPKRPAYRDAAEMRKQIEEGKQSELASVGDAIPKDIATRQWLQAGAHLARFEQLAAGDSRLAEWRRKVEAGLAFDRSLDHLRSSIRNAIRDKDWANAEAKIENLLAKEPDDPQAAAWRAQVAQGRKADLPVRKDSKRDEERRLELVRAGQLLQQADYPAAIELFQRVLAQEPGSARARSGLKQATDAKATEDRVFGRGR